MEKTSSSPALSSFGEEREMPSRRAERLAVFGRMFSIPGFVLGFFASVLLLWRPPWLRKVLRPQAPKALMPG